MVSSFGLHHRNERTLREMLRIHPAEHPVSIQLFGHDPDVMRSAAGIAAAAGADLIDINMGCPVRKVVRGGAGAALIRRPDLAVRVAEAAIEGSGRPVTVKLRSGIGPGDTSGLDLAARLVYDAGVSAVAFHPRSAAVRHSGRPDYSLVRRLVERLAGSGASVILSGGLSSAAAARSAYEESGADAVMIARGALGNPWIFEELTGVRTAPPTRGEVVTSSSGRWIEARSTWGPSAPRATCASSTRGTWSAWGCEARARTPFSGPQPGQERGISWRPRRSLCRRPPDLPTGRGSARRGRPGASL